MQINRIVAGLVLALATVIAADSSLARGGHRHHGGTRVVVGVGFGYGGFGFGYGYPWGYGVGFGYGYGYGYPYPYYYPYYPAYYPAPVVPQQPTVYIERSPYVDVPGGQSQAQQPQAPTGYWYFCQTTQAYYPYVKDCAAGWQRVPPQPAE